MENLMKKEDREIRPGTHKTDTSRVRIKEFKDKISDEAYLDHAISKIAADLSHYLTR